MDKNRMIKEVLWINCKKEKAKTEVTDGCGKIFENIKSKRWTDKAMNRSECVSDLNRLRSQKVVVPTSILQQQQQQQQQ